MKELGIKRPTTRFGLDSSTGVICMVWCKLSILPLFLSASSTKGVFVRKAFCNSSVLCTGIAFSVLPVDFDVNISKFKYSITELYVGVTVNEYLCALHNERLPSFSSWRSVALCGA
jgi:hypothetical protein